MKKSEVEIGATYIVKVSGKLTRVRITRESLYGGWDGTNIATRREVHIRGAQKLRRRVGATEQFFRDAFRAAYEQAGEPNGCYHCGSGQHKTSDCHQ